MPKRTIPTISLIVCTLAAVAFSIHTMQSPIAEPLKSGETPLSPKNSESKAKVSSEYDGEECGFKYKEVTRGGLSGSIFIDMDYDYKLRLYHRMIELQDMGNSGEKSREMVAKENNVSIRLLEILRQDAVLNKLPLPP